VKDHFGIDTWWLERSAPEHITIAIKALDHGTIASTASHENIIRRGPEQHHGPLVPSSLTQLFEERLSVHADPLHEQQEHDKAPNEG
jgi:hypothetical protein